MSQVNLLGAHLADRYTDATMIQQSDHIDAMTAVFIRDRYDAWKQGGAPGIFTTMI